MAPKTDKRISELIEPLRVKPGTKVTLAKDFDPGYKASFLRKKDGVEFLEAGVSLLAEYQDTLAAQDTWGVLVCLQALDAAGKDGTIRHVMSGVNPQGVHVSGFKVPSSEELDHDYLWRYAQRLPARGEIGIFNRSHYEEVLVVRVHPEILDRAETAAGGQGQGRLGAPVPGDQRLGEVPRRQRFQGRQAVPEPVQGGAADPVPQAGRPAGEELEVLAERREGAGSTGTTTRWRSRRCCRTPAREWAPWYVIPADRKWFARICVSAVLAHTLMDIDPKYPVVDAAKLKDLAEVEGAARGGGAEGCVAGSVRGTARGRGGRKASPRSGSRTATSASAQAHGHGSGAERRAWLRHPRSRRAARPSYRARGTR